MSSASAATTPPAVRQASAASAGPPKLVVAYDSLGGAFAPLWLAKAIGAFEKYGVSVDMRYVEAKVIAQAMIARSIDVGQQAAPQILTTDANGNEDLVYVASGLNHPNIALYTVPSITSTEQLRGKLVASDAPGTAIDFGLRLALSGLGLQPSDVQIRPIGGPSNILIAMLSGQVPAGMLGVPQRFQAEDKGLRLLQDISDRAYQSVGLVAKRSRLNELAPALRPLLAAYRDAILAWNSQPDVAMRVLDDYIRIGDPEILARTYDYYKTKAPFEASLQPTLEGLQAMIDFLASTTVPALRGAKPEQFVDTRFLGELPKA